jgi:hypothetical protein
MRRPGEHVHVHAAYLRTHGDAPSQHREIRGVNARLPRAGPNARRARPRNARSATLSVVRGMRSRIAGMPSIDAPAMTLEEAIRVLGIEGYPTTLGLYELPPAPPGATPHDDEARARWVVGALLSTMRSESPEMQAAYDTIDWAAGSPTELIAQRSQLSSYGGLEAAEGARRGAPKGVAKPRAAHVVPPAPAPITASSPRYFGVPFEEIYARARAADVRSWGAMQEAFDAALDVEDAPRPPIRECIELTLRLHAAGDFASADALSTTFARWLDGPRGAPLPAEPEYLWRVAQELSLASTLPDALRAPIAEAALTGDVSRAWRPVRAWCANRSGEENEIRLEGLRTDAPTIVAALARALQ